VTAGQIAADARAATIAGPGSPRDRLVGRVFLGFLLLSLAVGLAALGALVVDTLIDGLPHFGKQLLLNSPSIDPGRAGARPAILASLYLGILIIAFSVPLGVGTAVYLEEYARKERWYNRLLEVNIQNLAAVPSIVYGILGLAFVVRGLELGRVLIAGAIILTLVVLPTVIVASREAIRAVPDSIRQGGYALGATQWQVVWRQVLPASIPGIATGSILSVSRGIGETAPLLLVGALTFVTVNPTLNGPYTALPIQIFQWIGRPQDEFKFLAAGAIIVLLAMLLALNGVAIFLRNRYRKKW
jgi:phosphate transport system permease protein